MLRYKDLISFTPINDVVVLKSADKEDQAIDLVKNYVISDHMAEKLVNDIFENLQFERPVNNKGMLIVGNYGSGKSHLMGVVSTIAELPGSSQYIRHPQVAEKAKEIEGKFKVIRAEFGAVTMPLREIICRELSEGLAKIGIDYTFPAADQVTNNKDMLFEMMELFHEKYPDQGLLLVIDELLDYLRGRNEQELTLDLGFLREVGEVCNHSRFRFISGVQEMLFENPRFNFVADSLRRVKERFRETRIVREDIAFVVSERLLKKNEEQKALIREHLSKFTKLYNGLTENMETYVNMFPIHPSYLEMFEQVNIGEKRVALTTISDEIKKLLDEEVPENATGMISYDRYWNYIEANSSFRSDDRVKQVLDIVNTLRGIIRNNVRSLYKDMANQIVNALAIYRLTTDDLKTPIGLSSETLRDSLFISNPSLLDFDDDAAEFLQTNIDAAMKHLREEASFQYVSLNKENGQYYINIDKTINVEELINQRGETLSDSTLDSYYFDILKKATMVSDNTYVHGYKIWLHELPWSDRRIKRQGYLFFGAPNERSTAQPERDFYIYILQPFDEPKFTDEERPDEVFFRLKEKDEQFVTLLRLYGGAVELYNDTSTSKNLYQPKINEYQKKLVKWLRERFVDAFEVTYKGKSEPVIDHHLFLTQETDTLLDLIDNVAEGLLSQHFEEKYSDYPSFRKLENSYLTRENLSTYVKDALNYIIGKENKTGKAILDGLVLLDEKGKVSTRRSGYAQWVLDSLKQKDKGQVLNQTELIEVINTVQGSEDIRLTRQFSMEPELLVVILAALIQNGEIVVTVEGKQYEAMNLHEFVQLPLETLTHFSHIKEPSDLPVKEIQALIEMFDAPRADFSNPDSIDLSIRQIISKSKEATERTVEMITQVRDGFQKWDGPLFDQEEKTEIHERLQSLNEFLQGLHVYNTRAKMKNLKNKYDYDRIEQEQNHLKLLDKLEKLQRKVIEFRKDADYLIKAKLVGSPSPEWADYVDMALENLSLALKNDENCSTELAEIDRLKREYIDYYFAQHQKNRLNATENRQKSDLLRDPRYEALTVLTSKIDLFKNNEQFEEWKRKIESMEVCYHLTTEKLEQNPECTHCHFNPREEFSGKKYSISELDEQLDDLLASLTENLLTNFNDPDVKESITLLDEQHKALIDEFITNEQFQLPISIELINAINLVLKGIHNEVIEIDKIVQALGDGNPITVQQAKSNIEQLLRDIVGTNDANRIRLTVKTR
ncbi:DUF6079 family protein [Caldifermentibacillus hisashii]|uniref:DUF6079 family protein n=1 Tax=Caldifermentibacillus hisashii TaxID=996558 RepID=UPI002E23352C|nr:DUF6079 family protein [Caldifermentibacillus hisashii]